MHMKPYGAKKIDQLGCVRVVLIAMLYILFLPASLGAATDERVALVIGNSAYEKAPLANPVNDAKLIASQLRKLRFKVILKMDVGQKDMKIALRDFGDYLEKAGPSAVGLFYYAGHGVQVAGQNYLIPVDVDIQREKDVDIEGVQMNAVLQAMAFAGNRLNFVILDACRNNPFVRSFRSSVQGLARMDAPRGTLIAYATAPGDVAADGSGKNSPYSTALAKAMSKPGVPVERMFRQVRNEVMQATSERQTPWEASSLTGGDFFFNPQAAGNEIEAWKRIRDSLRTADFSLFLKSYPNGDFAPLARDKIAAIAARNSQKLSGWHGRVASLYEGEVTTVVRGQADKVSTRFSAKNGRLVGSYTIVEPGGKTEGELEYLRPAGENRAIFKWKDNYGDGILDVEFSKDFSAFTGFWSPNADLTKGGRWSGKRKAGS